MTPDTIDLIRDALGGEAARLEARARAMAPGTGDHHLQRADAMRTLCARLDDRSLRSSDDTLVIDATVLRGILGDHWLAGIVCNHEDRTDVARCSCSLWRCEPQPSVGAAVAAWIDHLLAQLRAAPQRRPV